jgi:hypothetical protein
MQAYRRIKGAGKGKFTLEQALMAQREREREREREKGYSTILCLTSALDGMGG